MTKVTKGTGSEQTGDGTGPVSAGGRRLGLQRKVELNFRKLRKLQLFFVQLCKVCVLYTYCLLPTPQGHASSFSAIPLCTQNKAPNLFMTLWVL